ncbi:hypothetical protein ABH920_001594 [Catenulispora sp. EB89]|uniref:hypothetical protein n=1 Tax=Catenulispora sp. EB89 TaxID=3156257 RepID=UPI0035142319
MRTGHAKVDAKPIIADLAAADQTVSWIEDELCRRLGRALAAQDASTDARRESGETEILDAYNPDQLLDAITDATCLAAVKAVAATDEPSDRDGTWRLLVALARIVPHPAARIPVGAVEDLRTAVASFPEGSIVAAPTAAAQWCRDVFGTRFAITAPFAAADGTDRWYLWDIDVCGGEPYTVGAGYFRDAEQAFAAWRSAVGPDATSGAQLEPVSDAHLAERILPGPSSMFRPGGESEPQYAEFHRCRRLAQELCRSEHLDGGGSTATVLPEQEVDKDVWIAEFMAWRAEHRPGRSVVPEDFPADDEPLTEAEVYRELAFTWLSEEFPEFAYTCSPHRIALTAVGIHDLYNADFADILLRTIPDLAAWLTDQVGLPDTVAARVRAYADSVVTPDTDLRDQIGNPMAQIRE